MKRSVLMFVLASMLIGRVWGFDSDDLSIKAGPTEPGEKLALVWIEAFVYPKVVRDERLLSLGVKTAAPVTGVTVAFDFSRQPLKLTSQDKMAWGEAFKIPAEVPTGVHVARYQISGKSGAIQRTVEFFIENKGEIAASRGDAVPLSGWPLTVVASGQAIADGKVIQVNSGQRLIGLSKIVWYKVLFGDGKEGWVPATQVSEPSEDLQSAGIKAYQEKNYAAAIENFSAALEVNPDSAKNYIWLTKSYLADGELDLAAEAILKAQKLDDRNIDAKVIAATLAQKFFTIAHNRTRAGRFHEAVAAYRKVLDLKPSSLLSWLGLGECYARLGLQPEARGAWREALKFDPGNARLLALTRGDAPVETAVKEKPAAVPASLADDSLQIVKSEKTKKGTKIESAIKSVVALTKSLGTPVAEKGWEIRQRGGKFLVSYLCRQGSGVLESFEWLVDVDTRQAQPNNDNARLLVSRW